MFKASGAVNKEIKCKRKIFNHFHNIVKNLDALQNFHLTASKMLLDYYL